MTSTKDSNPGDLPVGQHWIEKWPVRTAEGVPDVDTQPWSLAVTGLVENPLALSLKEVQELGAIEIVRDFHCVESWSVPNNRWKGVPVHRILEMANPTPNAHYAMVRSPGGYETDLPLDVLLQSDTILAWQRNGEPISRDHGYPLRLIVPDLYAYKSAKWVSEIELVGEDRPGYWEERGYHRRADVWSGERFKEDTI
ncbi:MAG: molybdopterin-dependent oxidoreductase [Deltaproteobacteria bacterium]|nr:molybdopterin-dependent oxidoreductase [Deltaproteobacteria bacterium]